MAESAAPKSFARRDHLRDVEQKMQARWEAEEEFTADAPECTGEDGRETFFCTFPYPYMNGRLHLGHAFTITKAEFAAGYQRLKGKNVLFPFSFHCTGMPIQAAANKLRREIEEFGSPPNFGETKEEAAPAPTPAAEASAPSLNKAKGTKSKTVAKTGKVTRQWTILERSGVEVEEIPAFVDPEHWLRYFPPHGKADLIAFGAHVDWRRSFITTSTNPFYDSFIRWQFNTLRASDKIAFGKRPTIFSVLDGQACADHDRASGEGVTPQEYTLIKLTVLEVPEAWQAAGCAGKRVSLVAATLRPETMYGQTNCFVLPDGDYGAFQVSSEEVYVCSARSARNMAFQGMSEEAGQTVCLLEMKGSELLGLPLRAPLAQYERVYTLPLLTISMGKGTGVVTSVPSDAPDDFAALRDLQQKAGLRAKFGIADDWVLPFEVVPILTIPGFGDAAAVKVCADLGIKSQNDSELLKEAKDLVYLKGFYEGVLTVGPHAGAKVCDAKALVRADLIAAGDAAIYYEPENKVVSRSGDECVVTYLDQWFLRYGEEEWKNAVGAHLSGMDMYSPAVRAQFEGTLEWLGEWACSRSFGLGTQLPWDEQFVIESLSDSTIYMAFYTIAHLLQGGVVDGSAQGPAAIAPEQLTHAVWDHIFLGRPIPDDAPTDIPADTLAKLRREFEYWYPMNLRVSGKDLIKNHLTMSLYNHACVWEGQPDKWPRGFFTNGHVMVNGEKMSKSKGNFIILSDAIDGQQGWGSDATRFALADAGDTLEDANFETDSANGAILRLTTEEEWIKSVLADTDAGLLRDCPPEEYTFLDRVFANTMSVCIAEADAAYSRMQFRLALKSGFFNFQAARDAYRDACAKSAPLSSGGSGNQEEKADGGAASGIAMHAGLLRRFIEAQLLMLAPITPHLCDYLWRDVLGNSGSITRAPWPAAEPEDEALSRASAYVADTLKAFRASLTKKTKPKKKGKKRGGAAAAAEAPPAAAPTHAYVYTTDSYPAWKEELFALVRSQYDPELPNGGFAKDFMKTMGGLVKTNELVKPKKKEAMKVAAFVRADVVKRGAIAFETSLPFDEADTLSSMAGYFARSLGLQQLTVFRVGAEDMQDPANVAARAVPGKPQLHAYTPIADE